MTIAEKVELTLIPVFGLCFWLFAPSLPEQVSVGRVLLMASALLLLQSLLRDLWLLASTKNNADLGPRTKARCMCVESTVGLSGVIVGAILFSSQLDSVVTMNTWLGSLIAVAVLSLGFAIKDYVIEWGPLRIRRDKHHMNIVFTWRS